MIRVVGGILLSFLGLSSLGFLAGQARAARLTVTLDYAAGTDCPDAEDFRAVVIARLGYDPFVATASDHVLVRIEPRGSTLHGRIEWRDASGRWTGDQSFPTVSSDCSHLARAMGFALAVEIQLLATAPPPDESAPAPPRSAPEAPPPAVVEKPAIAPQPRPVFAVGAGPSVAIGMSSGPVLLGRLFGALAWRRLSLELGVVAGAPATIRRGDGAGVSLQHRLGTAAACGTATRWTACLVANAGEVRMAGKDIDRPTSANVLVVQAGARAGIVQPLGRRARLSAHADGLVNLTRWRPALDQVPVWTAPLFAAALGVDATWSFP